MSAIDPFKLYMRAYGQKYRWLVMATVSFAAFVTVLSSTLIDVVIPNVIGSLGMQLDAAQWLASGFLLTNTVFLLVTASFVYKFGIRKTYLVGISIFVTGAILGGVASVEGILILSRLIQGVGAGLLQPLAVLVIARVFSPERRGLAMGIFGVGLLLGPTLGPLFAGVVIDSFDWRFTYFAQVPMGLIALVLGWQFLPDECTSDDKAWFNWVGFICLVLWVAPLLIWLSELEEHGLRTPWVNLLFLISSLSFGALIFSQSRKQGRGALIDLSLFRHARFFIANMIAFAIGFGLYGSLFLIPLYMQSVMVVSPTSSGLVLLPAGLLMVVLSPLAGHLSDLWAPRWPMFVGLLVFAGSILLLSHIDPSTSFAAIAISVCIGRVGLTCVFPSLYSSALRAVPLKDISQASGIINFSRQFGGSFGITTLTLVLGKRLQAHWGAISRQDMPENLFGTIAHSPHAREVILRGKIVAERYYDAWAHTYSFRDAFTLTSLFIVALLLMSLFMGGREALVQKL
jgi:EmrB/QacA subfamily drug resistance transporter